MPFVYSCLSLFNAIVSAIFTIAVFRFIIGAFVLGAVVALWAGAAKAARK